jgi:soluble lytic murein transglycosylase-like protein
MTEPIIVDINKIIQIESSGNPNAVNKKSGAVGLMQITQIALEDYNNLHPANQFSMNEMRIPEYNKVVGSWYINQRIPEFLKHYDIPDNEAFRLIAYNYGIGSLKTWYNCLPKESINYLSKYFNYQTRKEV